MSAAPNDARDFAVHAARVFLAEARRRRGERFSRTLLAWAANQRRRAFEAVASPVPQTPTPARRGRDDSQAMGDLFA